jgi:hypothetical protein
MYHLHIRIHRWVAWWICLGVVFGAVALINILLRNLSRAQEDAIVVVGIVHWVLGGLVCWALGSVKVEVPPPVHKEVPPIKEEREWHSASEFILPGGRKSILPPRY